LGLQYGKSWQRSGVCSLKTDYLDALVSFALSTAIAYVLGVVSALIFPVLGAPGVSALYVSAAIYVPLAIWMGMWGCLAGYVSCFFLGLWPSRYSPLLSSVWSIADFLEGLMPLLFFKMLKVDPDFTVKRPTAAKLFKPLVTVGVALLVIGLIVQIYFGAIYGEPFVSVYRYTLYSGLALSIIGILVGLFIGDKKTWTTYIFSGVILASVVSGIWGAWSLTLIPGLSPLPADLFPVVLTGWVVGDMIVLAVIATALLTALTPMIKRSPICVRRWWT